VGQTGKHYLSLSGAVQYTKMSSNGADLGQITELEAQLNQHSGNLSNPPSSE
jgi:hypothetical protein